MPISKPKKLSFLICILLTMACERQELAITEPDNTIQELPATIDELSFQTVSEHLTFSPTSTNNEYSLTISYLVNTITLKATGLPGSSFTVLLSTEAGNDDDQNIANVQQAAGHDGSISLTETINIAIPRILTSTTSLVIETTNAEGKSGVTYYIHMTRKAAETVEATGYFKPNIIGQEQYFGQEHVAFDSNQIAFGSFTDSIYKFPVRILTRDVEEDWSAQHLSEDASLSTRTAIDDDIIITAIPTNASSSSGILTVDATGLPSNTDAPDAGAVLIYQKDESAWRLTHFIKAQVASTGSEFGAQIASNRIDANTVQFAVSSPNNNIGTIEVFTAQRDSTEDDYSIQFNQLLTPPNTITETGDAFGATSIALSDNYLVVGVSGDDNANTPDQTPNNGAINSGAVYAYSKNDTGNQFNTIPVYIKASPITAEDAFGTSVTILEDRIFAAAPYQDTGATNGGAVFEYITTNQGETWSFNSIIQAFNRDNNDYFGSSVSVYNNLLAIGAYGEDGDANSTLLLPNNNAIDAGAVYIMGIEPTYHSWETIMYLKAPNAEAGDFFGRLVLIANGSILISAPYEDGGYNSTLSSFDNDFENSGVLYLFE